MVNNTEDNVTRLRPGRARTEQEALGQIRHAGRIEVASITALGRLWNWEQSRTSKAIIRWGKAGHIVREAGAGGHVIIRVPRQERQESGQENGQEGAQERQEAQERGQEHSIVSAQELGVAADAPGVPADVPALLAVVPGRAIVPAGVPAPIMEQPVEGHGVLAWCQWILGGLFILLSLALYGASLFLNATFWPGLAPTVDAKAILAAVGVVIETVNYATPSAISIASMSRAFKRGLWGFWIMTMTTAAVAGASFVRSNLGAAEVQRDATIKERVRLEGIIKKPMDPVSDAAVADARSRVETAKAVAKADCAPVRTKDIDQCNKSKAEVLKAQAALASENTNHTNDVKATEQRHRDDVDKAKAALEALPVISTDRNVILGGITALVPGELPEAWANRIVAGLWVILFALGPCMLLRSGLELLVPARSTRSGVKA
jgi:hypothetical protein